MFEAGLFVETFLPLFILSAYKNSVHCKSIEQSSEIMHLNPAHQSVKSCVRYLCLSSSEHEISIIKSWQNHVNCRIRLERLCKIM